MTRKPIINLLLLMVALAVTHESAIPTHAAPVKQVAKNADDLIRWLFKLDNVADDAARTLTNSLKRIIATGDDIAPELVNYIRKNFGSIPTSVYRDDTLLRFVSSHPDLIHNSVTIAKKFPASRLGATFEFLQYATPKDFKNAINHMASQMGPENIRIFVRSLDKPTANKQIVSLIDDFASAPNGSLLKGGMFEVIAGKQLSVGTMRIKCGLKKFSAVLDGTHDGIHGIDKIGIGENGLPVIIELTTSPKKNLAETGQLGVDWTVDRWNLLFEKKPHVGQMLIDEGMDPSWWRKINAEDVPKLQRKLIASSPECLTESNRVAVGLKMDDLLVLDN